MHIPPEQHANEQAGVVQAQPHDVRLAAVSDGKAQSSAQVRKETKT